MKGKKFLLDMIVPLMTRREIAKHLKSEISNNKERIETKAGIVAKKMLRAEKKLIVYQQRVGSNTLLTIYIYGIDKKGVDFAVGCWYHSDKGLCWASVVQNGVNFYNDHFFHRYAERYLKSALSVQDAAKRFYSEFKVTIGRRTKKIEEGVYGAQLPTSDGGLALGLFDEVNDFAVYNTYVSRDLLGTIQLNDVEEDRELNEALQNLNRHEYQLIVDGVL